MKATKMKFIKVRFKGDIFWVYENFMNTDSPIAYEDQVKDGKLTMITLISRELSYAYIINNVIHRAGNVIGTIDDLEIIKEEDHTLPTRGDVFGPTDPPDEPDSRVLDSGVR